MQIVTDSGVDLLLPHHVVNKHVIEVSADFRTPHAVYGDTRPRRRTTATYTHLPRRAFRPCRRQADLLLEKLLKLGAFRTDDYLFKVLLPLLYIVAA